MSVKIENKIVGYEVISPEGESKEIAASKTSAEDKESKVVHMRPLLTRPEELHGSTYKVKTPLSDHALYITINDIVVNSGTKYERYQPFEIFINSKNMENFAWIVALTRVISAVFRSGGDVSFLVEELHAVFDPRGGYYKPGGKYMPSLVAEIGECIEMHLTKIGMIKAPEVTEELKVKREQAAEAGLMGSTSCHKCSQLSMVRLDGCDTCLECGYSKCG
ncbi:MAG: TSCPD domain-containing protein [Gammaproteobacteria bacterium]|nr:TSCPD domain-containing protein [Gammaproteobacteria bacterium]